VQLPEQSMLRKKENVMEQNQSPQQKVIYSRFTLMEEPKIHMCIPSYKTKTQSWSSNSSQLAVSKDKVVENIEPENSCQTTLQNRADTILSGEREEGLGIPSFSRKSLPLLSREFCVCVCLFFSKIGK